MALAKPTKIDLQSPAPRGEVDYHLKTKYKKNYGLNLYWKIFDRDRARKQWYVKESDRDDALAHYVKQIKNESVWCFYKKVDKIER